MRLLGRLLWLTLGLLLLAGGLAVVLGAGVAGWRRLVLASLPVVAEEVSTWLTRPDLRLEVIAVGAATAIVGSVLIGVLLWGLRARIQDERLILSQDGTGEVAVAVESMRRLADHVVGRVSNVREVRSLVGTSRNGLRVRCRVVVDPSASIPDVAREVQNQVGAALAHHLGRPVEAVSVLAQITPIAPTRRRVR